LLLKAYAVRHASVYGIFQTNPFFQPPFCSS
jgi:hypothetical protein